MELRDVQFVVEATSEKMQIKKEVFRELAMEAGPKTIVATNTSALSVSELAEVTISPEHVIGLLRELPDQTVWLCSGIGPFQLPLTTIRQDFNEMGRRSLRLLVSVIEGDQLIPTGYRVEPELIVRGSTGPRRH